MHYGANRGMLCIIAVIFASLALSSGRECGENPMKQVLLVAKRTGRSLDNVLTVLRHIDAPAYEILARRFRMYAACVGLVDTGYFRKRSSHMRTEETIPEREYSSDIEQVPAPGKRLTLLAIPSDRSWAEEPLERSYSSFQEKRANFEDRSQRMKEATREQRMSDAADMDRSLTSIIRKAKMIMEAERMANNRITQSNSDYRYDVDDNSPLMRELFE